MKAGHELNCKVNEHVMQLRSREIHYPDDTIELEVELPNGAGRTFRPSEDMADAWLVVEALRDSHVFELSDGGANGWMADFKLGKPVVAKTAPLAICLAALVAVGELDAESGVVKPC
jgi:hypothetical protein